jgi:hypothetical protein
LTAAALLAHGYREWEYLAKARNPFLMDMPLFLVNNLKLLGLLILAVIGLLLTFTPE